MTRQPNREDKRLKELINARETAGVKAEETADYFGLAKASGRHTVRFWEEGTKQPEPGRRTTFIAYVGQLLGLWNNRERFNEVWAELSNHWGWAGVTREEWIRYALPPPPLPLAEVPSPAPLPPGSCMPLAANPLFVGRAAAFKALAAVLKGEHTTQMRLAAITGIAGAGKSQLACEFVHRYGPFFAGGVFWLSFAEPEGIKAEIAACGGSKGLNLSRFGTYPLDEQVNLVRLTWQEPIPRLLVFDNCEDPELLRDWLPTTGGCRILLTCRRAEWEAAYGINSIPLETLSRAESTALLQNYCARCNYTDAELDPIAAELGDLPLALHAAGSYLATYRHDGVTPTTYLHKLRDPQLLQHRSMRGAGFTPTRHDQNVGRTFALSYEKLRRDDPIDELAWLMLTLAAHVALSESTLISRDWLKSTLRLLGEAFSAPVYEAEDIADALRRLVNLGLIVEEATGALRIHRLIARFIINLTAGLQIRERGVQALFHAIQDGRLSHQERLDAAFRLAWLHWLGEVRDVNPSELIRYLDLITPFMVSPQRLEQGWQEITEALRLMPLSVQQQAHLLVHRAACAGKLDRLEEARQDYDEAKRLMDSFADAQQPTDTVRKLVAKVSAGIANCIVREYEKLKSEQQAQRRAELYQAVAFYQEAASWAERQAEDPFLGPMIYKELSYTFELLNVLDDARAAYHRALAMLEAIDERVRDQQFYKSFAARVLQTAGYVEWMAQNYQQAYEFALREISILSECFGETYRLAVSHINAGDYLLDWIQSASPPPAEFGSHPCEHWRVAFDKATQEAIRDRQAEAQERLQEHCSAKSIPRTG